jgi:hypothetical protein
MELIDKEYNNYCFNCHTYFDNVVLSNDKEKKLCEFCLSDNIMSKESIDKSNNVKVFFQYKSNDFISEMVSAKEITRYVKVKQTNEIFKLKKPSFYLNGKPVFTLKSKLNDYCFSWFKPKIEIILKR